MIGKRVKYDPKGLDWNRIGIIVSEPIAIPGAGIVGVVIEPVDLDESDKYELVALDKIRIIKADE